MFYVIDTTNKNDKGEPQVTLFEDRDKLILKLEEMCLRQFKMNRKQYMVELESIGFGEDDTMGRTFYESLAQYFDIGIIRKDSTPVRCNIFDASLYSKEEHGD